MLPKMERRRERQMEQMTLFNCLETIPEEDMVKQIGNALGIKFEKRDDLWGWVYKVKKITCSIHYSRYNFEPYERFISTSISGPTGGSSGPMDTIEEAISFMRSGMQQWEIL